MHETLAAIAFVAYMLHLEQAMDLRSVPTYEAAMVPNEWTVECPPPPGRDWAGPICHNSAMGLGLPHGGYIMLPPRVSPRKPNKFEFVMEVDKNGQDGNTLTVLNYRAVRI
jgi:hypothetical protein